MAELSKKLQLTDAQKKQLAPIVEQRDREAWLRIAAGNVPNLVDLGTGGWGKVILDPLNSSMTTTMAKLDTLGSLISAYATCRRVLKS
jgi:hypothetical protein